MPGVGNGLTVTVTVVDAVHECISVTVTEYGLLISGDTVVAAVMAELLHR